MAESGIKTVIVGATGAIGRNIVELVLEDSRFSMVQLIVRRELDQWKEHKNYNKLQITKLDDLAKMQTTDNFKFGNFNSAICVLGSRTKEGDEKFKQVDYTFCDYFAKIASENKINTFSLLTSMGADASSMFLYLRTKGQVEQQVNRYGFQNLQIHRPGVIKNRDNDKRCGETLMKFVPFIDKIEARELAKFIVEKSILNETGTYTNKQMLNYFKDK